MGFFLNEMLLLFRIYAKYFNKNINLTYFLNVIHSMLYVLSHYPFVSFNPFLFSSFPSNPISFHPLTTSNSSFQHNAAILKAKNVTLIPYFQSNESKLLVAADRMFHQHFVLLPQFNWHIKKIILCALFPTIIHVCHFS